MARIGKITIYVDTTQNGQLVAIRTVGKRGQTLLNTVTNNTAYITQSPFDTAANFWHDVLTKAQTQF